MILLLLVAFGMRLYRLDDLPPGLFHDEAYNTLDAQALAEGLPHPRFYDSWEVYARVVHPTWPPSTTRFPVFLEGNYGREPLFHYLGAFVVAIVGPRVWALRLVAASAGTVAVSAAYVAARELFAGTPRRARRLALLTAAVNTGIYSLLAFSRLGLRIILLVALEGFTVALWWRAARLDRLRWWVLAGLSLGLSQYTYIPSRLLLLIAVYPALVGIVRRPARVHEQGPQYPRRPRLERGTLLALLVALAVMAPLLVFFARYPAYLSLRAGAILADAPESGWSMVVANVWRTVQGLVWRGDPNPILNLPGRPALDFVQSVFLVVGAFVCLRHIRGPAYQFLLIWAALMHTPSLVAGVAPTFGRSIGGLLPVAIIAAVGLETLWAMVTVHRPRLWIWSELTVVGVLLFSIGLTCRDYFNVWAKLEGLPDIFHQEMASVGRYIGELPAETVVYITPTQKYYATLLLARINAIRAESPGCAEEDRRQRPRDFYGPAGLLPAGEPGRETAYLILEGDDTSAALLEATFPQGRWDARTPVFEAYRVPAAAARVRAQHTVRVDFADRIRLRGFDISSTPVRAGDVLSVRLTWQALAKMDQRYTAFVHLLGPHNPTADSPLWAQDDHEPGQATYTSDRWFSGEVIMDTFHLQVPANAPPGTYTLSTGFYDRGTLQRLPRSDATGDTATMTTITLVEQVP